MSECINDALRAPSCQNCFGTAKSSTAYVVSADPSYQSRVSLFNLCASLAVITPIVLPSGASTSCSSRAGSGLSCVLTPSIFEAWALWCPPVASPFVHTAILPPGLGSPARQLTWLCVSRSRCLGCVSQVEVSWVRSRETACLICIYICD